jgi:hypothetical protein
MEEAMRKSAPLEITSGLPVNDAEPSGRKARVLPFAASGNTAGAIEMLRERPRFAMPRN